MKKIYIYIYRTEESQMEFLWKVTSLKIVRFHQGDNCELQTPPLRGSSFVEKAVVEMGPGADASLA